ncbi:MAG: hypothetical protein UY92_C0010G0014 [Candidatus Magasanikbacteria bacterium GW2011_GWA2_56_11]|uniref:Uncharacterized protein n=1 Tax=Candidatus Magasanikbacteria bacterium GW2011_GWA2_56_11 TaxID=1619044 RepID=A0A0G1YF93_9BACT|nr:MAG: hypothetical protein UY92_C0010G0014 [Candidatus Magasanikbacteria bacterium GW2011_GWA2_56_11]
MMWVRLPLPAHSQKKNGLLTPFFFLHKQQGIYYLFPFVNNYLFTKGIFNPFHNIRHTSR